MNCLPPLVCPVSPSMLDVERGELEQKEKVQHFEFKLFSRENSLDIEFRPGRCHSIAIPATEQHQQCNKRFRLTKVLKLTIWLLFTIKYISHPSFTLMPSFILISSYKIFRIQARSNGKSGKFGQIGWCKWAKASTGEGTLETYLGQEGLFLYLLFLASQDALEVMLVTYLLTPR